MRAIKWSRAYFSNMTRPCYEDNRGMFSIEHIQDLDGTGYGAAWWIIPRDGSPADLEPRYYLADAKIAAEAEIKNREEIA